MSTVPKRLVTPPEPVPHDGFCDEQRPIPTFGPVKLDEHGRIVMSDEERAARRDAAIRVIAAIRHLPDDDPPDTEEQMMRGIDANRPEGAKLFEGMY
ncbi:MAG TPA: hypothetical protein VG406_05230 [Isosphaeraceae bacterium]|jgi:hypothetical protein|nr:hypothetical protein [Isosphaeraceae bacterium]